MLNDLMAYQCTNTARTHRSERGEWLGLLVMSYMPSYQLSNGNSNLRTFQSASNVRATFRAIVGTFDKLRLFNGRTLWVPGSRADRLWRLSPKSMEILSPSTWHDGQ